MPRIAQVGADCKAVLDAGIEVDLVCGANLGELGLGGVAELGGEDGVGFY